MASVSVGRLKQFSHFHSFCGVGPFLFVPIARFSQLKCTQIVPNLLYWGPITFGLPTADAAVDACCYQLQPIISDQTLCVGPPSILALLHDKAYISGGQSLPG